MGLLTDKCIIVGVTGGIAAYKAPDLVSQLVKAGADVHVIMTDSAAEFITPLTLQTISQNPVITGMFNHPGDRHVQHIALADMTDLLVVVPATANVIGKIRAGIADDILSTVIMATKAPVLFAPAMNVHMYENPIVAENIAQLESYGYKFIEPAAGRLACGYEGKGKLPEVSLIYDEIVRLLRPNRDLEGRTVLVSAGPTREYIDPVRYITNGSTGKMGCRIAEAARDRGARVILVAGPIDIQIPRGVEHIPVVSAEDMWQAVRRNFEQADIIVKSAAVADYTPVEKSASKKKKEDGDLSLTFTRTQDILKFLGQNKGDRILVGFAAETDDLEKNAAKKVREKNLDLIVANDITLPGAGFGSDTNIVKLLYRDGRVEAKNIMGKNEIANYIMDRVVELISINQRR